MKARRPRGVPGGTTGVASRRPPTRRPPLPFLVALAGRSASPLALLAVLALGGLAAATLGRDGAPAPCEEAGDPACAAPGSEPPEAAGPPEVVLPRDEACRDVAYLCAGLAERGPLRVLRWDESTTELRVLIPLPAHEDAAHARRLQEAAARGVRAWDRHPFPVRVLLRERGGPPPDVTVRWARTLSGNELGHVRTRWVARGGRATLEVGDFSLATRSPFDASRALPERQVELTAAHEMGHALGLPHSDQERDVMYPVNTAAALSARDYRTMQSLYRLPNGAALR